MDNAFQKWYAKHKVDFNAKRRIRYRTDLVYKNKILMAVKKNRKDKVKPVDKNIIGVKQAMAKINRTPQTARAWESAGYIPVQKNKSGRRYYTKDQIPLLKRLAEVLNDFRYKKATKEEVDIVLAIIKENWDAS